MRAWAGSMALAMVLLAAGCASITTTTTSSGATITSTPSDRTGEADPRKRAAVRLQLASSYYQQGLLRVALDEARAVVQMDSDLAGAYALLGLIYMDLDDRAQADDPRPCALEDTCGAKKDDDGASGLDCDSGDKPDAPAGAVDVAGQRHEGILSASVEVGAADRRTVQRRHRDVRDDSTCAMMKPITA